MCFAASMSEKQMLNALFIFSSADCWAHEITADKIHNVSMQNLFIGQNSGLPPRRLFFLSTLRVIGSPRMSLL